MEDGRRTNEELPSIIRWVEQIDFNGLEVRGELPQPPYPLTRPTFERYLAQRKYPSELELRISSEFIFVYGPRAAGK